MPSASGTALLACAVACGLASAEAHEPLVRQHTIIEHALPPMDGARLRTTIVEVTYDPGASSPSHTHHCPVIGYVVDGTLRSRVAGEREVVYAAGQSFYEAPNGTHAISANASRTRPARFIAVFTCDGDAALEAPGVDGRRP